MVNDLQTHAILLALDILLGYFFNDFFFEQKKARIDKLENKKSCIQVMTGGMCLCFDQGGHYLCRKDLKSEGAEYVN